DLTIDFEGLGKIVDNQLENKIDYLVVLGTTAETATLNSIEKQQIIDFICKRVDGKIPIVIGVGGNNTQSVIDSVLHMDLSKADAILSVVPYFSKPTQEGIYQHYIAISKASPLPLILYNVPGRTGVNMSAETTLRLAHATDKIIATKEASGNIGEITKILRDKPEGFTVLSGDDSLIVPMIAIGAEGVISVAANVAPKAVADLTHFALDGNFIAAAKLHLSMQKMCDALFADGNPGGAKAALHSAGIIENVLRLPLVPVSASTYDILARERLLLLQNK
ncbi:MAG TPA: 4-hydroxy-tetrahydrodipicolinate synthase, partial [Prolixibacteraceae bacterium]